MGHTRSRRTEKKIKKSEEAKAQLNELDADFISLDDPNEYIGREDPNTGVARDNRASFFGLLDRSELEYFKNAESILATNSLNAGEKEPFVENVFNEAKGKELKLATNQVCSKLVERLVQLANNEQMEQLVKAFEPFVVDLAYQKFSSHCLEALLVKATHIPQCKETLISIAKKLGKSAFDLGSDKYGAHVLSTLILTLSGLSLNTRSKKSQLARKYTEIEDDEAAPVEEEEKQVSPELRCAVREIVNELAASMSQVDSRKLAIGAESSPVMQALVLAEVELMSSYKLVNNILEDSSGFITHCLSDPIGSHFIETIIRVLPAKRAVKFVESLPLSKLAKSENEFAWYIVQAVLTRSNLPRARKLVLIKNDLKNVLNSRECASAVLLTAALEVDFEHVAQQLTAQVIAATLAQEITNPQRAALYEKLANYPPFVEKAADAIVAMDDDSVKKLALDPTLSYVLQSLLSPNAPLITRRKLVNKLVPSVPVLTVNVYGSHIVDRLWEACFKLKFVRERIASELLKDAEAVKHSAYGRKVWKNWSMEKYTHRRHEWWQIVKDNEDRLKAEIEPDASKDSAQKPSLPKGKPSQPTYKKRRMQQSASSAN